jgi:photosystem II stability/assembly factor-like uncharacterized protein
MKKLLFTIIILLVFSANVLSQSSWLAQVNPLGSGEQAMVGKIQFVSASEGWIAAGAGKLLHTVNSGATWTIVSPEPTDTLFNFSDPAMNMSFVNALTGYMMSIKVSGTVWQGTRVYKTTNGGTNWSRLTIPNFPGGIYMQFVDANNGWVLLFQPDYSNGGIFRTTNGGTNWNQIITPTSGFPYFFNSTNGWLLPVSPDGTGYSSDTIRKTTDGGVTWTAPWGTNAQVRLNTIHFSDVNNGWAAGRDGKVLKTTNGGTTWAYITNTGLTTHNSKAVFFLNANTGWIGTKRDATNLVNVLYTSNGGAAWIWQNIPAEYSIFSIHFFDSRNGGLTADYGAIVHTTNAGLKVENISTVIPEKNYLYQNYPNPFNPNTIIKFDLKKSSYVTMKIYDSMGREVETLVNEKLEAGTFAASWNGTNFPSGIYFYKMSADGFNETGKMILVK